MGLLMKLSLLAACVCVLQVYGYDEGEDEYKRALEVFRLLKREPTQEEEELRALRALELRGLMQCKNEGQGCRGVPRCCGTLQCYWEKGYSMRTPGECVQCVKVGQKCQRHSQCCSGAMCDKGNALWLDGHCTAPRAAGGCYSDKQCVGKCAKKWWQIHGACSSS